MFATADTMQIWVRLDPGAWDRLHVETGTRILKTREATGEVLVDFIAGGNLVRDSWYAPVQISCQRPYQVAGGDWFEPFGRFDGWAAVQLSVPKVVLGHSVAEYAPARHAVGLVLGELEDLAGVALDRDRVLVRRADFCRTLKLPSQQLAAALVDHLAHHCHYPNRRRFHREGETVMWQVRQESFKAYAKLPELLKRRGRPPTSELDRVAGFRRNLDGTITPTGITPRPRTAQEALRDAATGQVRFETTLRHQALTERFAALSRPTGHRHGILLPNFLDALEADLGGHIMRAEYDKLLTFAEVSTADDVLRRLQEVFKPARANNLYRFWELLCTEGDRGVREHYPSKTYYRHRAALKDAGIGVVGNDVELVQARRRKTQAEQLDLLSYLAGYGEEFRTCASEEYVEDLQQRAYLPRPNPGARTA